MEDINNEKKDNVSEESANAEENSYAYKSVLTNKNNSRLFSVISIASSALSIVFTLVSLSWVALILAALGIVFAIISRKNLGYFDNISLIGLIIGIFGLVFSVMGAVLAYLVSENPDFESFIESFKSNKR